MGGDSLSVPILYEANATDFNNLGLGPLVDTTVATVTEERNGQFILEMQYPVEGIRSSLITKNRILKVDAGHKLKDQRFVIKRINRIMGNDGLSYSIYAEHISYITADYALKPNLTISGSGNVAMTQWLNGIIDSNRIHVDSDITTENTTSWTIDKVQNARQALGGVQGSILDIWGGEYRFDNLNISLLRHRGTVSNTLLSYGRNITDFDQEENITNTYTSIYPFASYSVQNGDTSEQKILTIPDLVVDSEYVNNFPNRKIQVVDFSDKFSTDEKPTVERLAELAKSYIKSNNVGVPTVSTKISFVDLSKTENYKEFAPLEELDLCDEVPFAFEKFGIKTTAKISRIVWNVLLDSYDSLELGELKTNLSDVINNTNNAALDAKDAANDAKNSADNAALSANGKNRNWYGADDPAFGHLSELREGDSWYKPNGEDTELYHWINGQWVFILSTKDTHDAANAADEASKEAEEAKNQANKAVDGANDAVAKAGFANDTATQAKSDAAAAGQQAKDALTSAGTAITDAQNALTNSSSAMADSTQARKDSATAIKDAADSLTSAKDAISKVGTLTTSVTSQFTTVDNELKSKVNQTDYDKLKGTVTSQQTEINQNASGIKLKADTTALNELKGTVDKQGSEITLNTNSIKLKADQSSVDTLKGTVDKQGSAIDVNTKAIALKASQSTVDTLTGRVSTAEGKITVQADQISQTVSKTELTSKLNGYATQTWTQGKLDLTANSFKTQISSVQTNLDSLSFGYRNLIPNGSFNDGLNGWTVSLQPGEAINAISLAGNETLNGNHFIFMDGNNSASTTYVGDIASNKTIPLEPSTEYSLRIITRSKVTKYLSFFEEKDKNGNIINDHAFMVNQTDNGHYSANIQHFTTSATANYGNFRLRLYPGDQFVAGEIFLVQGNRLPKDWVSAPDDQATVAQFTSIEQTLKGVQVTANNAVTQSQYTQLAGQFTSTIAAVSSGNLVADSGWTGVTGVTTHAFYTGTAQLYYIDNSSKTAENYGYSPYFAVKPNTKYTLSFKAFADNKVTNSDVFLLTRSSGSAEGFDTAHLIIGSRKFSGSTSEYVTAQVTTGASDNEGYIRFDNNGSTDGTLSRLYFTEVQLEEGSTATPYKLSVSAAQSQITQLQSAVNLRVQKGDVVNQINISPESILIAGQKVHITGQTSIDNAVIKDAMIADIKADKITAGTLNAANVNVINLNANNITTGTIKGANLSMNLNTGEVVFQHGRIHSASNNVDVNIDQGYLSVANGNTRVLLKNGGIQFVQPTIFDERTNPYLSISNGGSGLAFSGARIVGRDYVVMANNANSSNIFDSPLGGAESFAGISAGYDGTSWHPTKIGGAERGIILSAGKKLSSDISWVGGSASICIGSDGSQGWNSNRIELLGEYVHSLPTYVRTASGSANVIVAKDGALLRSTSASKYKTDIIRSNIPDYGDKLLELPTATWMDIAETKRYRDDPVNQVKPTRNFGMIAEDLADAGLEMLVVRGADGELEGINYDRIGPALIPVIAKLKNEVETLKQKLEEKTA